jgi:hypothetical protein
MNSVGGKIFGFFPCPFLTSSKSKGLARSLFSKTYTVIDASCASSFISPWIDNED